LKQENAPPASGHPALLRISSHHGVVEKDNAPLTQCVSGALAVEPRSNLGA
jgi:hypothetical protein